MRLNLKWMIVTLAAVALLGTGPALASPAAQSPDAPDKDHSAGTLSRRPLILLGGVHKETAKTLAEVQKEKAELKTNPYTLGAFASDLQSKGRNRRLFID